MQYQIGDPMGVQHLADKRAPIVEMAAKMRCRQTPEQLIAEMQIDPMNLVAARYQGAAQPVEEIGDRPLQKQE
jgi:hypothetical protein